MINETEEWLPMRELPSDYFVSNKGRVMRISPSKGATPGKMRSQVINWHGYYTVMFKMDGKPTLRLVHRLVADAFLGPIPEGLQVNHKNGVKTDNRLENLEIVTNGENRAHSYQVLGVKPNRTPGEKNVNARLTWEIVDEIRSSKESYSALARKYGVSVTAISCVARRKTWRDIDRPATP